MPNLIGEGFNKYVRNQINNRQEKYGKKERSPQDIRYLNSRTGWVKMASSVSIKSDRWLNSLGLGNVFKQGTNLAKEFVLFNGTSALVSGEGGNSLKQREGIWDGSLGTSMKNNNAYGLGGTDFGFSPMPGIIDFTCTSINRGSLRKSTITIKANNRQQFEIIDLLYLRLGFTVLIEWGNSIYIDDKGRYRNMGSTLIEEKFFQLQDKTYLELLPLIEKKKHETGGNYDALFGRITNYHWNFQPDGSYNIKLDLYSLGDIIESLKINLLEGSDDNKYENIRPNRISKYLYDIERGLVSGKPEDIEPIVSPPKDSIEAYEEALTNVIENTNDNEKKTAELIYKYLKGYTDDEEIELIINNLKEIKESEKDYMNDGRMRMHQVEIYFNMMTTKSDEDELQEWINSEWWPQEKINEALKLIRGE